MSEEFIEIKETNGTIENVDKSATTEETKDFTLIEEIKREIESAPPETAAPICKPGLQETPQPSSPARTFCSKSHIIKKRPP